MKFEWLVFIELLISTKRNLLTWPKSMVRFTSLYFMPRDSGGLCHQLPVPSIAYSAGCALSGRNGSQ